MSTFTPAETLRKNRPLLLAMEAIGWFHMAGKARVEFLKKHGGEKVQYDERKWHDSETPPFPWDTLLEWSKHLYSSNIPPQAWPGSFAEFTEKHAGSNTGLLGLLQAAHGIVSGVEKNLPKSTSHYLNQTVLHMWLSSPWGYPKRNLLADPPEVLTPHGWKQLVEEIHRVLEELRNFGTQKVQDITQWRRWREQAIGENSFIRRAFLSTLAETRLPNNDVTLWDQSYVAAALFKSAVAGALLRQNHPWGDNGIKNKVRWRLLTVAIGTEHYEARSVKIGDWTGIQKALESFFDKVSTLIEVDLAVGSLLYRDSSAVVFSFPGELFDESLPASRIEGWEDWLQKQIDSIAEDLNLETPPHLRLSNPTRSLVPIVQEREEAIKVVAVPIHRAWNIRWLTPEESRGHVCPVCRMRLNGDLTSKAKPCKVCRDRRHHRRDDWIQGKFGYDTIWFDEVADHNGRLALLSFSLDIGPWLNGERVDSLRAQAIPEWARFNPVLSEFWQKDESKRRYIANPIKPSDLMEKLIREIKKRFKASPNNWRFPDTDLFMANLQEGFRFTRRMNPQQSEESPQDYEERLWKTFFQQIVEDRARVPDWDELTDNQRAAWLSHQLFTKLPSPGRVYRFWREAEEFFQSLLREFRQIAARSDNPWRTRRVVLVPKPNPNIRWQDLTLYNGRWRGTPISLVYVQSLGGFITASNLARLLQPQETREAFKGRSILLEEEDRFDEKQTIEIAAVRELTEPFAQLGVYAPIVPIEMSPLRFRVVVPLEAASECVDLAQRWWKERFARVGDRLPLQVGVVAFPWAVPYQAVVEATRNIEDALTSKKQTWLVDAIEKQDGMVALSLRQGEQTLFRVVPVTMPDGRMDVFYPYVEVEDSKLRFPRDFRHPDGPIFRHVADLQWGDSIKVAPAGLITLFMDSSAARFRVEEPKILDDWGHMRETWQLLKRVTPSQTALQRLRSDLAQLEVSWRNPQGEWDASVALRRETYRSILAHHLDRPSPNVLESLTQAAMKGWLTWALDWHLTVLKERL